LDSLLKRRGRDRPASGLGCNGFVPVEDLFGNDQPQVLAVGLNYDTPKWNRNRATKELVSGWTFGGILRYQSCFPIQAPNSNNALASLLFRGGARRHLPARVPTAATIAKAATCQGAKRRGQSQHVYDHWIR